MNSKAKKKPVRLQKRSVYVMGALSTCSFVLSWVAGCASTQFHKEGPGQPDDKAYGAVPIGMVGVCKRPFTQRPPIVSPQLWEHAKVCKADTPKEFLRLGYGHENAIEDKRKVDRMMGALREGPRTEGGNTTVLTMLRSIRSEGLKDKYLNNRVSRESTRTAACDFTYLLNTMEGEAARLKGGDTCAVYAYDQIDRKEVCLFDTEVHEAVWLTSAWACMTRTGNVGKGESCHKLCSYDDYCSRQVSCAQPDIDLALCALGVCTPEPEAI